MHINISDVQNILFYFFNLRDFIGIIFFKENGSLGLDFTLIFIKHVLSVLLISKTFVVFLRTSGEYLTRFR